MKPPLAFRAVPDRNLAVSAGVIVPGFVASHPAEALADMTVADLPKLTPPPRKTFAHLSIVTVTVPPNNDPVSGFRIARLPENE
jgi:hypothetical protein